MKRCGVLAGAERGGPALCDLGAIELLDIPGAHFHEMRLAEAGQVAKLEGGEVATGHLFLDRVTGGETGQANHEHGGG